MIMYLCMKYESNTPMFSKDIARKPFFVRKGQDVRDVRMYVRTYGRTDKGDAICPPPIINGGGIIIQLCQWIHNHFSINVMTLS